MDLLFAKWNIPKIDCDQVLKEISPVDESHWFYEPYRNTWMLPQMTKDSGTGLNGTNNRRYGEFNWVSFASPAVRDWCENILFPSLGGRTRIVILRTPPSESNYEHIDCDPQYQFTRQHKFRVVLQGRTDTLYFITKNGNIHAPQIDGPFIMDGSWPHGMTNNSDKTKYTLVAGSPWNGNDHYPDLNILIHRDDSLLPPNFERYYNANR